MENIIDKCIKYDLFIDNKDIYPYLENNDLDTKECKLKITKWLISFLKEIKKLGYIYAYSIKNKSEIRIDDLIKHDEFLFYSYEDGILIDYFILDNKKNSYKSRDDWEKNPQGILLTNDKDGLGLCFFMKKNISKMLETSDIPLWNKL